MAKINRLSTIDTKRGGREEEEAVVVEEAECESKPVGGREEKRKNIRTGRTVLERFVAGAGAGTAGSMTPSRFARTSIDTIIPAELICNNKSIIIQLSK